jgi:hypothetical protein
MWRKIISVYPSLTIRPLPGIPLEDRGIDSHIRQGHHSFVIHTQGTQPAFRFLFPIV